MASTSRKVRICFFTGSGISAESGLATFRGGNGLWDGVRVEDVATPAGWRKDRSRVLQFYNAYRDSVRRAMPNAAHHAIAELQSKFHVDVITQNVDDLHERAGTVGVVHLHGEIMKAQSSLDRDIVVELGDRNIEIGDKCEKGSQLRPNVVWFGEEPRELDRARWIVKQSDYLVVVGTSLQVYPAASFVDDLPSDSYLFVVDPEEVGISRPHSQLFVVASVGVQSIKSRLEHLFGV